MTEQFQKQLLQMLEKTKLDNIERVLVRDNAGNWCEMIFPTWRMDSPESETPTEDFINEMIVLDETSMVSINDKYIPFTMETFTPCRDYWFYKTSENIACKVVGYNNEGVTLGTDIDLNFYTWQEFMEFHLRENGTPAGIEVGNE